jgi:hypothetical protein
MRNDPAPTRRPLKPEDYAIPEAGVFSGHPRCSGCRFVIPNPINPGGGMGSCVHGLGYFYPDERHACKRFAKPGSDPVATTAEVVPPSESKPEPVAKATRKGTELDGFF